MSEKRKRVLVVTQTFYPENFKSNDIAFELAKRGYEVDALVSIPNYPEGVYYKGYGVFKKRKEKINDVNIYRVFQTPRGRKASSIGLSMYYLTYMFFGSLWAVWFSIFHKKYDSIFVFQTSPVTQALPAIVLGKLRGIPIYTWVLDIWPDAVRSNTNNKYIISLLAKFTDFVYHSSQKILISSKGFAELVCERRNFQYKIIYFPNWADDFSKMPKNVSPKLPKGFLIMMAGNLGEAQCLDEVMNVVLLLKDIKELKWIFVGDGSKKQWLESFISENKLEDVVYLLGRHPASEMPAYFAKADAMLLTLNANKRHLQAVVPARLQSYMSAGKPVLAMADKGCAEIIRESDCGFVVPAGNSENLAMIIKNEVMTNLEAFAQKGQNGYSYYKQHFAKSYCIDNLEDILNNSDN